MNLAKQGVKNLVAQLVAEKKLISGRVYDRQEFLELLGINPDNPTPGWLIEIISYETKNSSQILYHGQVLNYNDPTSSFFEELKRRLFS